MRRSTIPSTCGSGQVYRALRFNRISCIQPCLKSTEDRCDIFVAIVQKDERRTGARVLIWSGTVCDDPLVFIGTRDDRIEFDIVHKDVQRARDVTRRVIFCTPHIQE